MTPSELFADVLTRNLEMLKSTLADFSDADMLARPAPAANHAAWQLGHLTASEQRMFSSLKPGVMPELPAGFAQKFSPETTKVDDPAAFPKKAEILEVFTRVRLATIQYVKSLTAPDFDQPAPERIRSWCPTVGHLAMMAPNHAAMHIGQIQVIRRKLGKPILF